MTNRGTPPLVLFWLSTLCISILLLMTAISVARAEEDPTRDAVAAAQEWLKLVDRGEISKSWETAAEPFRKNVTEEKWKETIEAVRGPLGRRIFRKVELAKHETELPGAPAGEYVVIRIKGGFENQMQVTEVVTTLKESDGRWRVVAYLIQ